MNFWRWRRKPIASARKRRMCSALSIGLKTLPIGLIEVYTGCSIGIALSLSTATISTA